MSISLFFWFILILRPLNRRVLFIIVSFWPYADNCCSFCGQDEDHDPSEEFEEYLTCTVCGDHCMFIRGPGA